jgi:uncharacterized membrane protein (UPF0127 family)
MIRNTTKNKVLANEAIIVKNPFSHMLGLMFRSKREFKHKGMIFIFNIEINRAFHTYFMRFPIDILFLDARKQITKIARNVKPWKLWVSGKGKYVVELPAGNLHNTSIGDTISFK